MADLEFHNLHENFAVCGEDFRLERGPRRVEAKATKEVLSNDATAAHYRLPTPLLDRDGKPRKGKSGKPIMSHALDAFGKEIKEGETFTYLDHFEDQSRRPWYVYERHPREVFVNDLATGQVVHDEDGTPLTEVREDNFEEVGVFDTREEAEAFVRAQVGDVDPSKRKAVRKRPIPIRLSPDDKDPPLHELAEA